MSIFRRNTDQDSVGHATEKLDLALIIEYFSFFYCFCQLNFDSDERLTMINNDFFNVIKTLTKGQNVTFYYLDVNANRKEIICRYTSASKVGNVLYGKVKPN